ncbi:MAG: thiamine pyrophosphate-binding protein [Dehalococcoidia bacterium]|nr:thiamine pyrophosphate-binding protein [Dehalococcoidia bacterium]
MKNVDLIVQMLEDAGVKWAFGVPSGPVLPLIEAMRNSSIQYTLTASETSAGFMAQAVGALSGVPGVCVSTLGPGATNMATGVGAAWLDRSPVIAITCNVDSAWLDRRIQMRIDHEALYSPLTKASFGLRHGKVASQLAEALAIARAEPPGPVHLDLPEDVGTATPTESATSVESNHKLPPIPASTFEQVSAALAKAKRPLLIGGLTLTRASQPKRLVDFIDKQGLPFILTLHAKGFLPESHANYAGVLGRARRSDVQAFVHQADLIVAVGYDPIEINYEEWAGDTPIVHLSTETAERGEALRLEVNAAGDLNAAIESLAALPTQANDWSATEFEAHRRNLDEQLRPEGAGFSLNHVLDVMRRQIPPDAILAYDVGAHTHQIATQWRTDEPNTCLCTNGWSSMGYGIPAAYAAKLVNPRRTVVGVVGDGCFQMTAGELAMGRRLNLNVPIIVLNDGWLSLLKVKQERKGYGLSGVRLGDPPPSPPHYFGVPVRSAKNEAELGEALSWGLNLNGPSVIEAYVDAEIYSQTVYD